MSTQTTPGHAVDLYLERAGARLRWRLGGEGPAVALLHGWALDLTYWDPVAALLSTQFKVLRFDRCGFGLSQGQPDIHRNVADLAALLDAAAIERAVVVGMSQGARLAIHFALQLPARVRGLVLDGAPALEAESELPLAQYRRRLDAQGLAALQDDILQHPLMQLVTQDAASRSVLASSIARYRGLDLNQQLGRRRKPDLGAIAAPALVLNGSLDSPARRAAGRALQAAIHGAQQVELVGAGHLAALDDPAGYAATVAAFCHDLPHWIHPPVP
jgi:3-oxoadipate enol-lactonase